LANDTIINAGVEDLPFGGVAQSGLGSYHGRHSFSAFSRQQAVVIRNGKTDFQNVVRYQNVSGDYNSFAYSVIKTILIHPMRSEFMFNIKRALRKIPLFHLAAYIAMFFIGRAAAKL
jgi:hypothetical protein